MAFRFELKRIDAASDRISVEVNAGFTGYRLDVKTGSLVHGQLLGLDDDDHIQYSLTDGTRKFTGDVSVQGSVIAESPDGDDKVWFYHDNTNSWFKTDDGEFNFVTDEGDNTHSYVNVKGKGTGHGYLRVYDEDDTHYLVAYTEGNAGYIHTGGTGASDLFLQTYAQARVNLFAEAEEGETRELVIYGFRTGDGKFPLEIGVGVDAANTASFDGVANYFFDGNLQVGTTTSGHRAVITSTDANTLRLIGHLAYGAGARLDFGDLGRVYVAEDIDDNLYLYGYTRTAIMGGNVGIGDITPSYKLDVTGDINATGAVRATDYYAAGNQGITTTFVDNDGNTIGVTDGLVTSKSAPLF